MNRKSTAALAAVILALAAALSAQPAAASGETEDLRNEARDQAEDAHREALDDALVRMRAATRPDIDVSLPARPEAPASGD